MRAKPDPKLDELRDLEGRFFGRAPAQGWLKPVAVSFHRQTFRDVLMGSAKLDPGGGTDLNFTMHSPWAAPEPPAGYVKPRPEIFQRFLTLDSASNEELVKFGQQFGPLMVFCAPEGTLQGAKETIRERSEVWRYFARCMKALLHIAAAIHSGRRPDSADWEAIGRCPLPVYMARSRITDSGIQDPLLFQPEETWSAMAYFIAEGERRDLDMWARLLNVLLQLGRVRPAVSWEGEGKAAWPRLTFGAPRLISYLTLQLCLVALQRDVLPECSYCHEMYSSQRAPKTGQRNFCPRCRNERIPGLLAARDRRHRMREIRSK
jgi:hypothetical protein